MSLLGTPDDAIAAYRSALKAEDSTRVKSSLLKRFDERLRAAPDAAQAEAVTFDYLDHYHLAPRVLENSGTGGVDFECRWADVQFAVEVTAVGDQAFTNKSGMPNELQAGYLNVPGVLSLLSSRLSRKATGRQARTYNGPRVLAVTLKHIFGSILLLGGIEEFLLGGTAVEFCVSPAGLATGGHDVAQLRDAAFITQDPICFIRAFRRAYSHVLFIHIGGTDCQLLGALHPDPEYPLSIAPFRGVPFARLTKWPCSSVDELAVEWVVAQPNALRHIFLPVELR